MQQKQFGNIGEATTYGLGSGFGWFVAVVLIAAIREKIRYSHIPKPLRGVGMAFLITGLMGLAFLGFLGFNI
jgi:Na+-transporting NADH:ubiquinone oxidoreductase subunit E